MIIDMHVHSENSPDSTAKIENYIQEMKEKKIDAIVLTEHHSYESSAGIEKNENIRKLEKENKIKIFRAAEASTTAGHILLYGVKDDSWNTWNGKEGESMDIKDLINFLRKNKDVFAIPAHPCRKARRFDESLLKTGLFTAIETKNGLTKEEENNAADNLAFKWKLKTTGGSDSHKEGSLGKCVTRFQKRIETMGELVEELRKGEFTAEYWDYNKIDDVL